MPRQTNLVEPIVQALRGNVPRARDVAAALIATSVHKAASPRGPRLRAGGKIRLSESSKSGTVIAARNATLRWSRLFTSGAEAVLLVTQLPVAPAYLALAGIVLIGP